MLILAELLQSLEMLPMILPIIMIPIELDRVGRGNNTGLTKDAFALPGGFVSGT